MIEGLSESITFTGASITKYAIENVLNFLDARINENEAIIAATEGRASVIFEHLYQHALRYTFASISYKFRVDLVKGVSYFRGF